MKAKIIINMLYYGWCGVVGYVVAKYLMIVMPLWLAIWAGITMILMMQTVREDWLKLF